MVEEIIIEGINQSLIIMNLNILIGTGSKVATSQSLIAIQEEVKGIQLFQLLDLLKVLPLLNKVI